MITKWGLATCSNKYTYLRTKNTVHLDKHVKHRTSAMLAKFQGQKSISMYQIVSSWICWKCLTPAKEIVCQISHRIHPKNKNKQINWSCSDKIKMNCFYMTRNQPFQFIYMSTFSLLKQVDTKSIRRWSKCVDTSHLQACMILVNYLHNAVFS